MAAGLYSTCFALTLTTMALPQTLAAELRFLYVVTAILMVLAANRFFFPTSLKSQFAYNMNQLIHIHQVYLRLLGRSLKMPWITALSVIYRFTTILSNDRSRNI